MVETKNPTRPLSPHLQIYRPMLTMMMSIFHRITGVTLYTGVLLLVWWLIAAATSDSYFDMVQGFFGHWFGRLVLFGFTWALIHHMLGGIRHLVWDTGRGFELKTVELMARANLAGSIVITILIWIIGYGAMP
jgi:succinate dehydrogenase / fumarate reductase, cytochrome b subunit